MAKIYIQSLEKGYGQAIREGLHWLSIEPLIEHGGQIVIKPNLTFPYFKKGVMTNPEALEALIGILKNYTDNIIICEADSGGYNRFSMDEVLERTGIVEMARRYNVKVVNLTYAPSREIQVDLGHRKLSVPLPTLLLEETNLFITMPVPKIHMYTIVSISIKNQWGVIPDPSLRLRFHPFFKEVIYAINKSLPNTIAVVDGKYGLNHSGPLRGNPVDLNWIMLSDNIFYTDYMVTDLMGLDVKRIPYLNYILNKENISLNDNIEFNTDYTKFRKNKFYLKRTWSDYPGFLTFHSRILAYIGYESLLAKPLHQLLYYFRKPFY